MDIFIEHLVKKQLTAKDIIIRIALVIGSLLAVSLIVLFPSDSFWSTVVIVAVCGALFGAWYVFTSLNVEFEYAVTNGEIDIDKIVAQRSRKRLVTIKAQSVERMGRYNPENAIQGEFSEKIFVCDSVHAQDVYYLVCRHAKKGRILVVMNMPQRVFGGIKMYLPREILNELNYGN